MLKERRLGQGLDVFFGVDGPVDAALPPSSPDVDRSAGNFREIPVDRIDPNPFQPRTEFDETGIAELAASIERQGLYQPILVRPHNDRFELVAGERRLRAYRHLGRSVVPAIIRDLPDGKLLIAALLENLQRRDLNPIEKARAFKNLLGRGTWTQEQAAAELGIDRSTLANFIRLLELPEEIQDAVSRGTLSMGHARALLAAPSSQRRAVVFRKILADQLSVRATERLLSPSASPKSAAGKRRCGSSSPSEPWIEEIETKLRMHLGTKVRLHFDPLQDRGEIVIELYGSKQLDELLKILGINDSI